PGAVAGTDPAGQPDPHHHTGPGHEYTEYEYAEHEYAEPVYLEYDGTPDHHAPDHDIPGHHPPDDDALHHDAGEHEDHENDAPDYRAADHGGRLTATAERARPSGPLPPGIIDESDDAGGHRIFFNPWAAHDDHDDYGDFAEENNNYEDGNNKDAANPDRPSSPGDTLRW
ncbi:MAG: hypothetical protein WAK82_14110, partial [Streptosporangiaceae bacterium]